MSSAERLKQVVSDKLAAVAEEIFTVFHNAIVEYEKELDRQRKMLELAWKPEVELHRIELPQQLVLKEELILEDQSSLNQDRNSTADQEEEVSSEELRLKEEPEDLQLYFPDVENNRIVDTVVNWNPEEPSQEREVLIPVLTSVVSAVNSQHSLYPGVSQSQEQTEDECGNSMSTRHKRKDPNSNVHKSQTDEDINVTQKIKCKSNLQTSQKSNVDQNENVDETLGVSSRGIVLQHKTVQTGKKQHVCQTCGKSFSKSSILNRHKILHTGERPYVCQTCGSSFTQNENLIRHKRIHTGERPYVCQTCGKDFRFRTALIIHERIHTGEKPYVCQTCRKCFRFHADLKKHERIHTGERPYFCKTCGKCFTRKDSLKVHEKRHC